MNEYMVLTFHLLQRQEKEALKQSEDCAEGGNVDASMTFAQQAEAFSKQHTELYKQFTTPERTMSVCEVCGVFINSTDNDQRKAVSTSIQSSSLS